MKNLTITDIPDATYERLKEAAAANQRSLNNEILALLETVAVRKPRDIESFLARADETRAKVKGPPLTIAELIRARDRGRR
jgi:plasmid stability protein